MREKGFFAAVEKPTGRGSENNDTQNELKRIPTEAERCLESQK